MTNLASFATVTPESSISFNVSGDTVLGRSVHLHVSAFRNHVRDLIETLPIAIRQAWAAGVSYLRPEPRIVTQRGVSMPCRWRSSNETGLSVGYQFLDTRDLDVIEGIDRGQYFGRKNDVTSA